MPSTRWFIRLLYLHISPIPGSKSLHGPSIPGLQPLQESRSSKTKRSQCLLMSFLIECGAQLGTARIPALVVTGCFNFLMGKTRFLLRRSGFQISTEDNVILKFQNKGPDEEDFWLLTHLLKKMRQQSNECQNRKMHWLTKPGSFLPDLYWPEKPLLHLVPCCPCYISFSKSPSLQFY